MIIYETLNLYYSVFRNKAIILSKVFRAALIPISTLQLISNVRQAFVNRYPWKNTEIPWETDETLYRDAMVSAAYWYKWETMEQSRGRGQKGNQGSCGLVAI